MFEGDAELQSRYSPAIHGDAHMRQRNNTIQHLVKLRECHTASFSVDFTVNTWGQIVPDYNEGFGEGVRMPLRMLPKQRKRDQVDRIALSADSDNAPVMHCPDTFDMEQHNGLR